jgi:hypothetical protein
VEARSSWQGDYSRRCPARARAPGGLLKPPATKQILVEEDTDVGGANWGGADLRFEISRKNEARGQDLKFEI